MQPNIKEATFHPYFKRNKIKISHIDCGGCIATSGECFLFGSNFHGQIGNNNNDQKNVYEPYLIKSDGINNDIILVGSCGYNHTILLSNKNTVITFGYNKYNQCSTLITDEYIISPHILSSEMTFNSNQILSVLGMYYESIIFIAKN